MSERHDKAVAAAVWLAKQGAFIGWGSPQDGKAVARKWKQDMTDDPNMVPSVLTGGRNSVIVPQGRMVIIDVDKHGWYERLQAQGLPPTFTVASPTVRRADNSLPAGPDWDGETFRGRHIYVNAPAGYDVTAIPGVWAGGETRRSQHGEQSMVLGPWSMRADGVYEPLDDAPRSIATVDASLLDWLKTNPRLNGTETGALITIAPTEDGEWTWDGATMGSRHDHLRDRIRAWRGIDADAESLMRRANAYIERHAIPRDRPGSDPLDDAEIGRMIKGALDKYHDDPPYQPQAVVIEAVNEATGEAEEVSPGLLAPEMRTRPAEMNDEAYLLSPVMLDLLQHFHPRTDASVEGLHVAALTYLSALVGSKPSVFYGSKQQHAAIFSVLVGPTSHGRKGTTTDLVRDAMTQVTEEAKRMKRSPNSGEGLINLAASAKGEPILIEEEEMSRLLVSKNREGATLSHILRQAFDGGVLTSATSTRVLIAEKHHVALLGNATPDDIEQDIASIDVKNGFANRMLWCAVMKRDGHQVTKHDNDLPLALRDTIRDAIRFAKAMPAPLIGATMALDPVARDLLLAAGERYTQGVGMAPFLSRRLDTIAARIAIVLAVLDQSRVITDVHTTAALAVTDYAYASNAWLFRDTTGAEDGDLLLRYLRASSEGFLDSTQIEALIGKRTKDKQRAFDALSLMGYAREAQRPRRDGKPGRKRTGIELVR